MAHMFMPGPRPEAPILPLGCGFQGLTWICLTRITQKGILFNHSFCPPRYELTPSFSSSELMLPCQPLPAGIQAEMGWPDLEAAGGCEHILVIGLEQSSRPLLRKPGAWPSSC